MLPKSQLLGVASVFKNVGSIALAIMILLVMVTIHEFGHYVAGKILRFKINEFSVGFGPALFKKRSKKTGELFALRIVPLGGYCAFDGEDEEEAPAEPFEDTLQEKEDSKEEKKQENAGLKFNDQPPWKRIIVLVAGATMNYLLALFLILVMFLSVGQPLYCVMPTPPASESTASVEQNIDEVDLGLKAGDLIEKVNGKTVYLITDYMDAIAGKKRGDVVPVTVLRETDEGRVRMAVEVVLVEDAEFKSMSETSKLCRCLGVYGLYGVPTKQGWSAVPKSFGYSVKIGGVVLRSLGELLTGKMGLDSMGGPVTTIQVTSEQASSGLFGLLNIAAFIGVNLAVFNLLPVPALDGSKVIFCLIEWIRKKPINRKVETMIHFIGILFLFAFAILVDVVHFLP